MNTYLEALQLVKERRVEIALIDYNVAAWLQEDIIGDDLRITMFVKQNFHKHIYVYEVSRTFGICHYLGISDKNLMNSL